MSLSCRNRPAQPAGPGQVTRGQPVYGPAGSPDLPPRGYRDSPARTLFGPGFLLVRLLSPLWPPRRSAGLRSGGPLVQPEADLQRDLEVAAPVLDPAPHVGDLEPVEVVQGLRGAGHGAPDRIVDALRGGADDLADGVNAVCHR